MKTYKQYIQHLQEVNVKRFLKDNNVMSPEEKKEVIDFFTNRKTKFKDWQNAHKLSYDDFKPYMTLNNLSYDALMRLIKSKGIKALKKGTDYLDVSYMFDYYKAYIPLNFTASRAIASKGINKCKGNWCSAINKGEWDEYKAMKIVLIYLIDPNENDKRVVAYLPNQAYPIQVFDASNNSHKKGYPDFELEHEDIDEIIRKNGKKLVKMVHGNNDKSTHTPNPEHWY
jgi:hypothetical protein